MAKGLSWFWTRLYDGVELHHVEQLQKVIDGNEVIYVPCHRSHIDYLLLSYVIYYKGYAIPHIAAGVNLKSVSASGLLAKAAARRGSPLAGVKEEIGSKLTATAAGRFLPCAGPPAANAGDSMRPTAAMAAAALAVFDPRMLTTSDSLLSVESI